jgi:hypothetical protein
MAFRAFFLMALISSSSDPDSSSDISLSSFSTNGLTFFVLYLS